MPEAVPSNPYQSQQNADAVLPNPYQNQQNADAVLANPYQSQQNANATSVSSYIEILRSHLERECLPDRAPVSFDQSLEAALHDSLSRTLLEAGFQVWFAYFLADNADSLSFLSPTDLKAVTTQIAQIKPHQTVRELFHHLFFGSSRAPKRRQCLESIGVAIPALVVPNPRPVKRPRTSLNNPATTYGTSTHTETSINPVSPNCSVPNTNDTRYKGPVLRTSNFTPIYGSSRGFNIDPETQLAFPSASTIEDVFTPYLRTVIATSDGNAWLKASFEKDPAKVSLECFIAAEETQTVVKDLFGITIIPVDGQWAIRLDNGVIIRTPSSQELSGSLHKDIRERLGEKADRAYQFSPKRMAEVSKGQMRTTNCLSIKFWPEADCPSLLKLSVEVLELSMILPELWPGTNHLIL